MVPWIVNLAALLCTAGALLLLVGAPARDRQARRALTASVIAALAAPLVFARSVPRALAALQGLEFGVGGTLGLLQLCLTVALLAGLSAAMLLRTHVARVASVALLLLPALAFLMMFPAPGGLAFAAAGTAIGFGAGRWLVR
jgi:hypothetical protein